MSTVYLDPASWDLAVDASGNIALATDAYATAQSVANACRLWRGEAPYNTDRGIPYEEDILGKLPTQRQIAGWFEDEASLVPEVTGAVAVLRYADRQLTGQILCTLEGGTQISLDALPSRVVVSEEGIPKRYPDIGEDTELLGTITNEFHQLVQFDLHSILG